MSQLYVFRNAHEASQTFARRFWDIGTYVPCGRTGQMLELRNVCYDLTKPNEKWLSFDSFRQARLWAYSEVLTEFLGINPPLMERYTKNKDIQKFMKTFHRGDGRHNYTYGERWHNNRSFQKIIERLQNDRFSRQALMNIYDGSIDLDNSEWNIPCTIIHHFAVRKDKVSNEDVLHLNVYMRSNDFFRGFKYDTFLNGFILEAFAGMLRCKVGTLSFFIGSFHVHNDDIERLALFRSSNDILTPTEYLLSKNAPLSLELSFEDLYANLWKVKELEEKSFYTGNAYEEEVYELDPYFVPWAMEYINFNINRHRELKK